MNINKNYLITLGVSTLVMFTILVIVLMLMLPKQSTAIKGTISNYEKISRSQYTFESTKDITSEPLKKQYSITSEDIDSYKTNSQYTTGNNDPFAPVADTSTSTSNSTSGTSSSSSSSSTTAAQEATNKTTNSNGGVANPSSTSK